MTVSSTSKGRNDNKGNKRERDRPLLPLKEFRRACETVSEFGISSSSRTAVIRAVRHVFVVERSVRGGEDREKERERETEEAR